MTTFDNRQKGFENKFAHEKENEFRIIARRNKLVGLWAAEKMGLENEKANAYADEVVQADFEEPGSADVVRKLVADMNKAGITVTDQNVSEALEKFYALAKKQMTGA